MKLTRAPSVRSRAAGFGGGASRAKRGKRRRRKNPPFRIVLFLSGLMLFIPLISNASDVGDGSLYLLAIIFGIPFLIIIGIIYLIFIKKINWLIKLAIISIVYILTGIALTVLVLKYVLPGKIIENILFWPISLFNGVINPLLLQWK